MPTPTSYVLHRVSCVAFLLLMSGSLHPTEAVSHKTMTAHYTYQQADGNRFVSGKGTLPAAYALDIPVPTRPEWLVAAPLQRGSLWVAIFADGTVRGWRVHGRWAEPHILLPSRVRPGAPPALLLSGTAWRLLLPPLPGMASPLSHPVLVSPVTGHTAFLDAHGGLRLWRQREINRVNVKALPDARVLVDAQSRLLLYTHPTSRYQHGVLGDQVEAAGMTLLETAPRLRVLQTTMFPENVVAEGIAPIWTDISGDGRPDILVTLSDAQQGAQLVVYSEVGERIASSDTIGQGSRWRHQLAVAPFGPQGAVEVATVLTPHIGGVVEFYRLVEGELRMTAQVSGTDPPSSAPQSTDTAAVADFATIPMQGFGSHVLGSRNLDLAVAGDMDGDGRIELVVPNQDRTHLAGIRRTEDGASVVWSVPVGGTLHTNLAAVTLPNGTIALGAGHTGNAIRVWLPR